MVTCEDILNHTLDSISCFVIVKGKKGHFDYLYRIVSGIVEHTNKTPIREGTKVREIVPEKMFIGFNPMIISKPMITNLYLLEMQLELI